MQLHFHKYQGAGNDFILLDQRNFSITWKAQSDIIRQLCDRRFGIGADGLMLLQNKPNFDFEMVYYNADGGIGSMCGNGGRCIVAFAKDLGIISNSTNFIANDGPHSASFTDGLIALEMIDVPRIEKLSHHSFFINTGSPHYVEFVKDLPSFEVFQKGKEIRYSTTYAPKGINVNFVEKNDENGIQLRTYERGVEDETLACGTGATAAAMAWAFHHKLYGVVEIPVKVLGGNLSIQFNHDAENGFSKVFLIGPAQKVFEGTIEI